MRRLERALIGTRPAKGNEHGPRHGFVDPTVVQEKIKQAMYNPGDESQQFITFERVQAIWQEFPVWSIEAFKNYSSLEMEYVEGKYLLVLSILVLPAYHVRDFSTIKIPHSEIFTAWLCYPDFCHDKTIHFDEVTSQFTLTIVISKLLRLLPIHNIQNFFQYLSNSNIVTFSS